MNDVSLKILGAAETVTGSKYLLRHQGRSVLIDCGLFQGLKALRLQNWEPFAVDPKTIDAVILTHAHIDHSGYIPRLIAQGFRGKIFCTAGTLALVKILLPETGYLEEERAEYLNRRKLSKHEPALPLFTRKQAELALAQFEAKEFHEDFEPVAGFHMQFLYAGHILGAAMVVARIGATTIGFSGDVGRLSDPIFRDPENFPQLDALVVESTYGNRQHPRTDPKQELEELLRQGIVRRSVMLIPAFTVGRTQTLLHFLAELKKAGRIDGLDVFLNSPMATNVTESFCKLQSLHKLSDQQCQEIADVAHVVQTVEESKRLNLRHGPLLIVSASGMATGGRILHHLKAFAPDSKNMIILTGFQALGTRGRALHDGAQEIKIHGEMVPVRASVHSLDNLSAHADGVEIAEWLGRANPHPRQVFITHGEPAASVALAERLRAAFKWNCVVPKPRDEFTIG